MRFRLLFLLLALAISVPFATADTIQLTGSNIGLNNIGFVTLTAQGGGVQVTLTANSGFAFKMPGGDILFNTGGTILTASSISNIMVDGAPYTGSFSLMSNQTRGGFAKSDFDITGLKVKGINGATTISFFISGATLSGLESGPWGVHFCTLGTSSVCSSTTGFASSGGPTTVPEPGTLSLLGTGILGLAGFFRRRLLS
jgi:hypothetical protein